MYVFMYVFVCLCINLYIYLFLFVYIRNVETEGFNANRGRRCPLCRAEQREERMVFQCTETYIGEKMLNNKSLI
jgi:hypothetical protein